MTLAVHQAGSGAHVKSVLGALLGSGPASPRAGLLRLRAPGSPQRSPSRRVFSKTGRLKWALARSMRSPLLFSYNTQKAAVEGRSSTSGSLVVLRRSLATMPVGKDSTARIHGQNKVALATAPAQFFHRATTGVRTTLIARVETGGIHEDSSDDSSARSVGSLVHAKQETCTDGRNSAGNFGCADNAVIESEFDCEYG